VLDVSAALAPAREHESRLEEDLAPVVKKRWPLRDRRREGITETQPVGERAKSVQADVGCDTGPAGFHLHARCAGTVHFGSALLEGDTAASTQSVSLVGRAFPRMRPSQVMRTRE
jgi:hypothetical protein